MLKTPIGETIAQEQRTHGFRGETSWTGAKAKISDSGSHPLPPSLRPDLELRLTTLSSQESVKIYTRTTSPLAAALVQRCPHVVPTLLEEVSTSPATLLTDAVTQNNP